ncbi:MAG: hypothetical protein HY690_01820, partial [Chloroflexi bacterium]|nr:hypothetical protein [Chloroflexota bacterium]
TEKPAAQPTAKPAATAAVQKPPAKPTEAPAAKPAFDEKAVADFYRGKNVKLIVGHAAGGGYDLYSRLIARHLGKHIPGSPNVVVENMTGGDGGISANHLYRVAPKDGTVMGNFIGDLFLKRVLGQKGLEFEVTGWNHLGAPAISEYVCMVHKNSGFASIKEALNPGGRELILGGYSILESAGLIIKDALDANIKMVSGYDGTSTIRLAVDRGEVHGMCGNSWESLVTTSPQEMQDGTYRVILQLLSKKKTGVPQADAPLVYDFAKTEEGKALIRLGIESQGIYGRPYVLPPGVPQDRVQAVRQAFQDALRDPALLADAEKSRQSITPKSAEEVERLIKEGTDMSASVKARLKAIILPGQ